MNKPFENYFSSSLYDLSSEIKKNESNIDLSDFSQIFFNKRKFSDETEKFKKVLVFYIGCHYFFLF